MKKIVWFFKKKIWFSWLVFIHERTKGRFSIHFSHVMVSIGFHYENWLNNWVENWMTIWKLPNTRNNVLERRGENAPPYKNTTIKCNSCSRQICYNFVTCIYLLLKSKDVHIQFKPKDKQNIIKHFFYKSKGILKLIPTCWNIYWKIFPCPSQPFAH